MEVVKKNFKVQEIFVKFLRKNFQEFPISSNACKDIGEKKFNKVVVLPDVSDITSLHKYLSDELSKGLNQIKNNEGTQEIYKEVCQNLLAQIILLNRRRSGEVERIKINDYLNRNQNNVQDEIKKSLTEVEEKFTKSLVRFEIRGKKGRGVPVILTPTIKEILDLVISKRKTFNVLEANQFMFARPYTVEGHYRGTDCLRQVASKCGASHPELLRSTKLRKHIATVSQLLNLTPSDRDQLANFMGHDLLIHNEYYKLPDETLQISRVSKILLAMEAGNLHELRGKTLDEFDNFIVPVTQSSDSESDKVEDSSLDKDSSCDGSNEENVFVSTKQHKTSEVQKTRKRGDYKKWSHQEINAIKRSLGKFIALQKVPQQHDCLLAIKQEPILSSRGWRKIKYQAANLIKKNVK